ncbi:CsbD family protein [Methylobacterium sp. P5_C11]
MTENRTTTSAEHLKGSVKEAIGKLTGDARTETEGRRQTRDASASKAGEAEPTGPGRR